MKYKVVKYHISDRRKSNMVSYIGISTCIPQRLSTGRPKHIDEPLLRSSPILLIKTHLPRLSNFLNPPKPPSNVGSPSVERSPAPQSEEQHDRHDGGKKPEQHVDQVNPHCVLHSFDPTIALWVRMDVQFAKDTKDCRPENTARGQVSC